MVFNQLLISKVPLFIISFVNWNFISEWSFGYLGLSRLETRLTDNVRNSSATTTTTTATSATREALQGQIFLKVKCLRNNSNNSNSIALSSTLRKLFGALKKDSNFVWEFFLWISAAYFQENLFSWLKLLPESSLLCFGLIFPNKTRPSDIAPITNSYFNEQLGPICIR